MAQELTEREVRIVNFIEQKYYETGQIPTNEIICAMLNLPRQVPINAWKKELFRKSLTARGISLDTNKDNPGILTQEQLLVANIILNIHDKTTIRKKLETVSTALGKKITVQTYNGWLQQPAFQNYIRTRIEKEFGNTDTAAKMAHIRAIHDGDMNAVKLYYEMTGLYNPRLQVDVNIEAVIMNVIEIISRHVQDPATLEAIAGDIERLDMGKPSAPRALEAMSAISI